MNFIALKKEIKMIKKILFSFVGLMFVACTETSQPEVAKLPKDMFDINNRVLLKVPNGESYYVPLYAKYDIISYFWLESSFSEKNINCNLGDIIWYINDQEIIKIFNRLETSMDKWDLLVGLFEQGKAGCVAPLTQEQIERIVAIEKEEQMRREEIYYRLREIRAQEKVADEMARRNSEMQRQTNEMQRQTDQMRRQNDEIRNLSDTIYYGY